MENYPLRVQKEFDFKLFSDKSTVHFERGMFFGFPKHSVDSRFLRIYDNVKIHASRRSMNGIKVLCTAVDYMPEDLDKLEKSTGEIIINPEYDIKSRQKTL